MRNIFLASILTFGCLLLLALSSSAQNPSAPCQEVRGQITCGQIQSNGCMQNPPFNTLFPISPYQTPKQYHGEDHFTQASPLQTSADSWDCKIATSGPRRICVATHGYHNRRMSNVYMADNDQVVRCFWDAKYRDDQENMGTLLAKGTTMYPGFITYPNGLRLANQVEGGTYPVNKSEFDCCQPVSYAEQEQIKAFEARNGQLFRDFRITGMLFERIR